MENTQAADTQTPTPTDAAPQAEPEVITEYVVAFKYEGDDGTPQETEEVIEGDDETLRAYVGEQLQEGFSLSEMTLKRRTVERRVVATDDVPLISLL